MYTKYSINYQGFCMNNFFLNGSDMFLFKRAMRETKNEPVVINILSSDPSLKKDVSKTKTEVVRKTFSDKFEPSPFGKFFGPRKTRTTPFDMSDFSSWKNKNYRDAEKSIGTSTETFTFSLLFMHIASLFTYFNQTHIIHQNQQERLCLFFP